MLAAIILHVALGGAALACAGDQKGSTIFADQFADDSGGWDLTEATVQPPNMIFNVGGDVALAKAALNQTFNATDGDYCVDIILPAGTSADNSVGGGLVVWAADYRNMYTFQVFSNGVVGLWRLVNKEWSTIFKGADLQLVKPYSTNNLHVVIKDGLITMSVNGKEVKKVRAQTPPGPLRFGLRAQSMPMPGTVDVKFQNFKVTSGS